MRTLIHPTLAIRLTPYHFTDLVTIQRNTATTRDAYGGLVTPTWAAHLTAQECRYIMLPIRGSIDEKVLARLNAELSGATILIPGIVDVTPLDRISAITDADGNALAAITDIKEVTFHTSYTQLVTQEAT